MRSSPGLRCRDLQSDRRKGQFWQDQFVDMARSHGCVAEDKQKGKELSAVAVSCDGALILPDIQVSKLGFTVAVEVKHKDPTKHGQYGYEEYRLLDLVRYANATGMQAILAIHDHKLAGGRDVTHNRLRDWRWMDVTEMERQHDYAAPGVTYFGGEPVVRQIRYWDTSRFAPLADHPFFRDQPERNVRQRDPSRPAGGQKMLFPRW